MIGQLFESRVSIYLNDLWIAMMAARRFGFGNPAHTFRCLSWSQVSLTRELLLFGLPGVGCARVLWRGVCKQSPQATISHNNPSGSPSVTMRDRIHGGSKFVSLDRCALHFQVMKKDLACGSSSAVPTVNFSRMSQWDIVEQSPKMTVSQNGWPVVPSETSRDRRVISQFEARYRFTRPRARNIVKMPRQVNISRHRLSEGSSKVVAALWQFGVHVAAFVAFLQATERQQSVSRRAYQVSNCLVNFLWCSS